MAVSKRLLERRVEHSMPWIEHRLLLDHLPRLIHSGPIGVRRDWNRWNWEFAQGVERFIYHLFDGDGEPVYFGKAWCPLYRLEKHARKPWWPEVAHINLYSVSCEGHRDEPCDVPLDRVAVQWEHHAIRNVQPRRNIAAKPTGAVNG